MSVPSSDGREADRLEEEAESNLLELIPPDTELPCGVDVVAEFGDPGEAVLRVAGSRGADLIVMGSRTIREASTYLPSTIHRVLMHSRCPVLAVRGSDC